MATVQLKAGESSIIETSHSQGKNSFPLWRNPVQMFVAKLNRSWWHTKAYGTILGIMLLVLVSLLFIYLYSLYRKFLPVPAKKAFNYSSYEYIEGDCEDV